MPKLTGGTNAIFNIIKKKLTKNDTKWKLQTLNQFGF